MNTFFTYLALGFRHITDLAGYDHILFIVSLCVMFTLTEWKKILLLVTCFTIGHSVSLFLSVANLVQFDSKIIEFLIPVTIIFTCISNLFGLKAIKNIFSGGRYVGKTLLVVFFGLIHGLGFSNYLKALLGSSKNILLELFSFNFGLELGQIIILCFFYFILTMMLNNLNVKRRDAIIGISCLVIGLSFQMLVNKWVF